MFLLGVMRFATVGAIILFCFVHLSVGKFFSTKMEIQRLFQTIAIPLALFLRLNYTMQLKPLEKYSSSVTLMDGLSQFLHVFAYAHILHQGIPALTHPIKKKHWLGGYINLMFLVLGLIYMALGLLVSFWFSKFTIETCTLNWVCERASCMHHLCVCVCVWTCLSTVMNIHSVVHQACISAWIFKVCF